VETIAGMGCPRGPGGRQFHGEHRAAVRRVGGADCPAVGMHYLVDYREAQTGAGQAPGMRSAVETVEDPPQVAVSESRSVVADRDGDVVLCCGERDLYGDPVARTDLRGIVQQVGHQTVEPLGDAIDLRPLEAAAEVDLRPVPRGDGDAALDERVEADVFRLVGNFVAAGQVDDVTN
jgi:hypothetical protein